MSVTLGDDEARRRRVQKSVLEREGPPTFGAAVELDEVGRVRVHLDVGVAVDTLLAGYEPPTEMRVVDEHTGRVLTQPCLGSGAAASGGFGAMFGPGGPAGGGVGLRSERSFGNGGRVLTPGRISSVSPLFGGRLEMSASTMSSRWEPRKIEMIAGGASLAPSR